MRASTRVWLVCSSLAYQLDVCETSAVGMRASTRVWLVCGSLAYQLDVCGTSAVGMRASTRVWLVCSLLIYQLDACGRRATDTCAGYMFAQLALFNSVFISFAVIAAPVESGSLLLLYLSSLFALISVLATGLKMVHKVESLIGFSFALVTLIFLLIGVAGGVGVFVI